MIHERLRQIYDADQADRRSGQWGPDIAARDADRRNQVDALIAAGIPQSGEDYFAAAMIFQHGGERRHFWRAHMLARRGAELGHDPSRWLVAASFDRWLISGGKPQKYGTQYLIVHGEAVLFETDPSTSDAERARWGVPPLARSPERGRHA